MDILLVCLGNICRSPLAEGILREKLSKHGISWNVDSAGTGSWHVGAGPDKRSIKVAKEFSIDIKNLKARQFSVADFDRFDLILAMDERNFEFINRKASAGSRARVAMMLDFLYPGERKSVPDPYYGGDNGFYQIYELLDRACDALIDELVREKVHTT
jgi:protein-tyrosine phosphatase